MQRVILLCDNTFGVKGCDVDDGLALLMLLGSDAVKVEAVCTCYGNSTIDVVHENTLRFMNELKLDIPVYKGAASPAEPISEAAKFMAAYCAQNSGEVAILSTGSTTDLLGAQLVDADFFKHVPSITMMGGVTESLHIKGGKIMDELNLSCDPHATLAVLSAPCKIAIASAQNCMPAFFTWQEFADEFGEDSWILQAIDYWFDDMDEAYKWNGWVAWDPVAAAMLTAPQLFDWKHKQITLYERFLSVGYLEQANKDVPQAKIAFPEIKDVQAFKKYAFEAWKRALL